MTKGGCCGYVGLAAREALGLHTVPSMTVNWGRRYPAACFEIQAVCTCLDAGEVTRRRRDGRHDSDAWSRSLSPGPNLRKRKRPNNCHAGFASAIPLECNSSCREEKIYENENTIIHGTPESI